MSELWVPTIHWWELILRSVLVYLFLIVVLRLTGKRQVGQLAPFDLVLLLVLSNAVQNSMNGGDNSLTGGLISAATLIASTTWWGSPPSAARRWRRSSKDGRRSWCTTASSSRTSWPTPSSPVTS